MNLSTSTRSNDGADVPSTAERFAQLRKEHFDSVIPELVASAVAARAADDFRAAVAEQVATDVRPMQDATDEAQARVEDLTRALNTVEAERVAPLQAERDALAAQVQQLSEALQVATADADRRDSGDAADTLARTEQAAASAAELAALQDRYQTTVTASAELASRVAELEARLVASAAAHGDAAAAMCHDATSATTTLAARVTLLEASRDAAENERDERGAEADVLKIKLAAVLKERAAAAVQIAQLEGSVDALTARIRELDGSDDDNDADNASSPARRNGGGAGSGPGVTRQHPAGASSGNSPISVPGGTFAGSPTVGTVPGRRAKRRGRDQAGNTDALGSRHAGNHDRSARAEVLEFWRAGHDRIAALETERDGLIHELSEARAKAAGASELVEQRPRLVAALAAVTAELETSREEHRRTAAALVAARAEAKALQGHLTSALHTAMSAGDISACAAALRTAAERTASSEAATLALDPAAAKRAAQELQALQHELVEQKKAKAQLVATNLSLHDSILALQTASVAYRCITGTADSGAGGGGSGNQSHGWGMLPPPTTGSATPNRASAPVVAPEVLALVTRALAPPTGERVAAGGGDGAAPMSSSAATIAGDLKLKRLQDLQTIAKLKCELAATAAARDAADAARADLESQLAELRASSERDAQRLRAMASHSRDELRSMTATLAATKTEHEELRNASAARNEAAAALRTVTAVLAEQLRTTTAAAAEARAAAVASRSQVAALSRDRDAAVRNALRTLGDDVLVGQLERQLEAVDAELQRRRRRDEANDASTHARLIAELSKQAVALQEATSRARDLAGAASSTATAREESERWCNTVEEALATLRREHTEALRAATDAAAVAPAELTRGLVAACSAGVVGSIAAPAVGRPPPQQQRVASAAAPPEAAMPAAAAAAAAPTAGDPPSERAPSSDGIDDDDDDDDNPFGSSFLATTAAAFASADAALSNGPQDDPAQQPPTAADTEHGADSPAVAEPPGDAALVGEAGAFASSTVEGGNDSSEDDDDDDDGAYDDDDDDQQQQGGEGDAVSVDGADEEAA